MREPGASNLNSIAVILLVTLFLASFCHAGPKKKNTSKVSPYSLSWSARGGGPDSAKDEADGIAVDTQGNLIISGVFNKTATFSKQSLTSAGAGDIFVIKYESNGTIEWIKRFGSTGDDNTFDCCTDSKNNIIINGWFTGTVEFDSVKLTSKGYTDMFLAKLSPDGSVLWAKSMGGSNRDGGNEVVVDSKDNIIATAISNGNFNVGNKNFTNKGKRDAYVLKFKSDGSLIWARETTGSGQERVRAIGVDGLDNVYAGFQFKGELSINGNNFNARGMWDGLVAKWDRDGKFEWARHYGGVGLDNVRAVGGDKDGNAYVAGVFSDTVVFENKKLESSGRTDSYILKLDSQGKFAWIVHFASTSECAGAEIEVSDSGKIFLSESLSGEITVKTPRHSQRFNVNNKYTSSFIFILDTNGNLQWSFSPDDSDFSSGGAIAINNTARIIGQVVKFRGKLDLGERKYSTSGRSDKDFAVLFLKENITEDGK